MTITPKSGPLARAALAFALAVTAVAVHGGDASTSGGQPGQGGTTGASAARGWITYQIACGSCHGPDGVAIGLAPDLLQRMRTLSQAEFIRAAAARYRVSLGLTESLFSEAQRDAVLAEVGPRPPAESRGGIMPSWQSDPVIRSRMLDLHAYLKARSEGTLGPGRPGAGTP